MPYAVDVGAIQPYAESAWASLPVASANTGAVYSLTDSWATGLTAKSDGTYWKLSGKARFAVGAPNDVITSTTSRTAFREITIPGGLMGTKGTLTSNALLSMTNNANNKFPQAYIYQTAGGLAGGTVVASIAAASAASLGQQVLVRNTAANGQVFSTGSTVGSLGSSGTAPTTAAVDTSQDWIFCYAATPANSGDTLTLLHYNIEIDQRF